MDTAPRGLKGLVVAETALGDVRGEADRGEEPPVAVELVDPHRREHLLGAGLDRGHALLQAGAALGRVTPDGAITEFPLPANTRGVGLTAGSDRQPPERLADRLWYADAAGNKIGYLEFE